MRYYLKFMLSMTIALFAIGAPVFASSKNSQSLDKIVAVVNDSIITQSELNQAVTSTKKQLAGSNVSLPPSNVLHKQVLDQLINKKLQLQLADQMGIQTTDEQVDKTINEIAANNKVSVTELYQKVAEEGVNKSDYRKDIHDQLTLQQVQQQTIGPKLNITPQEVDDYMRSKTWEVSTNKEYHLEDILIALPEAPSPQDMAAAKKHADEVLTKIRGGMSFSQAAAAESGENNALQGGDLGWRKLPEIPSAFAKDLVHMKSNDLLGPVQTPNGFHIIRLVETRDTEKKMKIADQRKQVEQLIYQRKLEEALQSWVTKLRSDAFINTSVG
jgi:peptidyl-prolyl cis-trans isomerase SurA